MKYFGLSTGRMTIRYDSGNGLSFTDYWKAGKLLERFFQTENDPSQAPITKAEARWVIQNIPDCVSIIRDEKKVIGITFFFPVNASLMKQFLQRRISEHVLWETAKMRIKEKGNNCLYTASAFILPEYRGKGLVRESFRRSIEGYSRSHGIAPRLFFEGYTPEGRQLALQVAKDMGLPIKEKRKAKKRPLPARSRPRKGPRARR